jgi:hypothetical protein
MEFKVTFGNGDFTFLEVVAGTWCSGFKKATAEACRAADGRDINRVEFWQVMS